MSLDAEIEALFSDCALQSNEAVAKVLGISGKTLRRLGDAQRIGWQGKGVGLKPHRLYTLEDVKAYLEKAKRKCQRTSRSEKTGRSSRSVTTSISGLRRSGQPSPKGSVVRRARERKHLLKKWKTRCENSPPSENSASS